MAFLKRSSSACCALRTVSKVSVSVDLPKKKHLKRTFQNFIPCAAAYATSVPQTLRPETSIPCPLPLPSFIEAVTHQQKMSNKRKGHGLDAAAQRVRRTHAFESTLHCQGCCYKKWCHVTCVAPQEVVSRDMCCYEKWCHDKKLCHHMSSIQCPNVYMHATLHARILRCWWWSKVPHGRD
jgi:hypothetical protein